MSDIGLISIIMAAYNAEKSIEKAVESVISQSYQNWELLVINDCSTDNTAALVEKIDDPRIRLIHNAANSGVSFTRHHGLQEARGQWIAILDSDDAWTPEKLEKQVQYQIEKNADLLFTASKFMNAAGEPIDWVLHAPAEIDYRTLLKQNLVSNSSVLVRKALYEAHMQQGDGMHEDFATWLRILKTGIRAYGINEPLLIYRISTTSKTGNKLTAAKMNWKTYRAVGLNVFEAGYYMIWYTINGLRKYRNLK